MKKSIIRTLSFNDIEDFMECLNNPELQNSFQRLYTTNEEEARIILNLLLDENRRKERLAFGIKESESEKDSKIVGLILSQTKGDTADLICLINPLYQGKGYAFRGLKEAMKWVHRKNKEVKNFQMLIGNQNEKSKKLAGRLGFECKGESLEIPELIEYQRTARKNVRKRKEEIECER